ASGGCAASGVTWRSLEPLDEEAVLAATDARLVVTLEDHFLRGGLHTMVAELLLARGRTAHVVPLALPGRWFRPALLPAVLEHERSPARPIAARFLEALWSAPRAASRPSSSSARAASSLRRPRPSPRGRGSTSSASRPSSWRAARAPASGTSTATATSTSPWRSGRSSSATAGS